MKVAVLGLTAGILVLVVATAARDYVPPPAALQLASASDALGSPDAADAHQRIVDALGLLADAIQEIAPPIVGPDAAKIRGCAKALAQAGVGAKAELVRLAFEIATRALRNLPPSTRVKPSSPEMVRQQQATEALAVATGAIDPAMALRDQYALVHMAFREATRTVFAASGAPEPVFSRR